MCGEQLFVFRRFPAVPGSSPRVRGTDDDRSDVPIITRFIPACAGNRFEPCKIPAFAPVHPRVCGEQPSAASAFTCTGGSSPRVRGTGDAVRDKVLPQRFIPACAGNSRKPLGIDLHESVHPRVCGEQRKVLPSQYVNVGSSPRVRGTDNFSIRVQCTVRFIPACAGNRRLELRISISCAVHPRVCGEQPPQAACPVTQNGSSPRVRGTAYSSSVGTPRSRFIPACAGNRREYRPV